MKLDNFLASRALLHSFVMALGGFGAHREASEAANSMIMGECRQYPSPSSVFMTQ
jgi:hypothetical protein